MQMKISLLFNTVILFFAFPITTSAMQKSIDVDDTVPLRYRNYYYTDWYDECDSYINNGRVDKDIAHDYSFNGSPNRRFAKYEHTSVPLNVVGLVALVRPDFYQITGWPPLDTVHHAPEYMYLLRDVNRVYTIDDTNMPGRPGPCHAQYIDSVRFDNVVPRVMELSQGCDSVPPRYCLLYEAYFDQPIMVDSTFYIYRSDNGSELFWDENNHPHLLFKPLPRYEVKVKNRQDHMNTCHPIVDSAAGCQAKGHGHTWQVTSLYDTVSVYTFSGGTVEEVRIPPPVLFDNAIYYPDDPFGWTFAIVENYRMEVFSDSLPLGDIDGTGIYYNSLGTEIRAIPHAGYMFTHWNDGNTDNPRIVYLTQDTSFTAYFADAVYHEVQTSVNNSEWGYVEGGGVYAEHTMIELTAVPYDSCRFVKWSDGDTVNPRTVTVLQDSLFGAEFCFDSTLLAVSDANALDLAIAPNPAGDRLTVTTAIEGVYHVEIYDNLGRCQRRLLSRTPQCTIDVSWLPAGRYLLCLRIDGHRGSRPFIKQ